MTEALQIRLLGGLELSVGGELLQLPSSKKTRALLGYLVLTGGRHTRSALCDLLWDGPADPRAALRWSLTKLRPLVDGETPRLVADRERVGFEHSDVAVDLDEVRAALESGPAGLGVDELEGLVRRFRGELLEGLEMADSFAYAHWLAGERGRARGLHAQLLASLTKRLLDEPARGLGHASRWVALEPLDEGAHARLVELLLRLGRHAEASEAADACTRLFERELGRSPGSVLAKAMASADGAATGAPAASGAGPVPVDPVDANPAVRAVPDVGLFGRADECAAFERFLDAGHESGGVLWLEGAAGVGKSRLLAELGARARGRGLTVLTGKAYEAESGRPLAVWGEALGRTVDGGTAADRTRLFERLLDEARALGEGAGLLVVLDDLQWVDEASAELVSWLAREAGSELRLAISVRPGEVEDNPAAVRLRRALARLERLEPMEVGPLGSADAQALVRSIDQDVDPGRLFDLSGGNPLFAIELARSGEAARSPRLRRCIEERLEHLTDTERELVRVAAALGRRFSLDLAAEVTGLRPGELLAAAEGLERAGLVRPEGEDQLDFAHDLMREAAYAAQSEPARRLLHRRIARTLAGDPRSDLELAPDLARHASLAGEHALAARASVAAGEHCLRLFAGDEALAFARRGANHAVQLDASERRELVVELLALEVHAGLGRREPATLRAQLDGLAVEATGAGQHAAARKALYLLSVVDEEAGAFDRAEAHSLAAASAGRAAGDETKGRALANTGRCLAQLERGLDQASAYLAEAEGLPAVDGVRLDVAWGSGLLAWHRGDLDGATDELERALALATEQGNHWAAFECASRLVLVDVEAGQPARARARGDDLEATAARLDGGSEAALAAALMALVRYAEAGDLAAFEPALEGLRRADSKAVLAAVLNTAAELDLARGHVERARTMAEEARAKAGAVGRERQLTRAESLLERCSPPQAP